MGDRCRTPERLTNKKELSEWYLRSDPALPRSASWPGFNSQSWRSVTTVPWLITHTWKGDGCREVVTSLLKLCKEYKAIQLPSPSGAPCEQHGHVSKNKFTLVTTLWFVAGPENMSASDSFVMTRARPGRTMLEYQQRVQVYQQVSKGWNGGLWFLQMAEAGGAHLVAPCWTCDGVLRCLLPQARALAAWDCSSYAFTGKRGRPHIKTYGECFNGELSALADKCADIAKAYASQLDIAFEI